MKKHIYYLPALLLAGCMSGGCDDRQEDISFTPATSGESIQFSVSTGGATSRTEYGEEDELGWTLNWENDDQIGIYTSASSDYVKKSPNGGDRYAVYQISEVNPDGHQHEGSIEPLGTEQLVWGSQIETFTETLDFYGAYPAERIVKYPSQDGTDENSFEMQYWTNQKVTVTEKVDNVYKTEPDMKNAYMIAKQAVQPSGEHILLHFDPIMTTLNITITAGKYEVATGIINPVTVTGVSVIMPKALKDGQFVYQTDYTFKEDDDSFVTPGIHGFLKEGTVVDNKESVFVGVEWADEAEEHTGERFVDLFEGESITLMAFLPPVEMLEDSGAKIKVHTTGALNFVLEVTPEMIQQSRIEIQLPDISPESENELMVNNWISQLDGNIKWTQLSIPGYDCNGKENKDDIEQLLKLGIRAFDIDELCGTDKILGAVEAFQEFFQDEKNNGEFIITMVDSWSPDELKNENLDLNSKNWKNQTINNLKGQIISLEYNILGHYIQDGKMGVLSNCLFGAERYDDVDNFLKNSDWNMRYRRDGEKENYSSNQSIYNQIISSTEQTGCCTGILMVPLAGTNVDNGTYTYSDLLLQAIIDCNYKFH